MPLVCIEGYCIEFRSSRCTAYMGASVSHWQKKVIIGNKCSRSDNPNGGGATRYIVRPEMFLLLHINDLESHMG